MSTYKKGLLVIAAAYGFMMIGLMAMVMVYAASHDSYQEEGSGVNTCGELPLQGDRPSIIKFQRCLRNLSGVAPTEALCTEHASEWVVVDGFEMCLSPGMWGEDK